MITLVLRKIDYINQMMTLTKQILWLTDCKKEKWSLEILINLTIPKNNINCNHSKLYLPLLLSLSSCNVLSLDVSSFDVTDCDASSNRSNLLKCLFLICETSTKVIKATKEKKMKKWTKNLRTKWKQFESLILTPRCILIEYWPSKHSYLSFKH